MDRNSRCKELQSILGEKQAVLLTHEKYRLFYIGFASSAGVMLITKSEKFFIVDFRYIEAAREINNGFKVILQENLTEQINALINECKLEQIVLDSETTTVNEYSQWTQELSDKVSVECQNDFSNLYKRQFNAKNQKEIQAEEECRKIAGNAVERLRLYAHNYSSSCSEQVFQSPVTVFMLRQTLAVLRCTLGDESATFEAEFSGINSHGERVLLDGSTQLSGYKDVYLAFNVKKSQCVCSVSNLKL